MSDTIQTELRFVLFWVLLTVLLNGCVVPIPVDDEVPYSGNAPNLKVGSSTKNDVINLFGEPGAVYSHGSIFVYSDFEETWLMPYFLAAPGCCGADAGVATFGNRHYLVLNFDERDILENRKIEVGNGRAHCSNIGLCFTVIGHIVWFADDEEESRIKEFPTLSSECGIYLYLEGTVFPRQTSVTLDGDSLGYVGSIGAGFFYIKVKQGDHEIIANQVNAEPESARLPVVCNKNEHYFVRLKIRHNSKSTPILELVDNSTGRRKIRGRHLLIPQSSR